MVTVYIWMQMDGHFWAKREYWPDTLNRDGNQFAIDPRSIRIDRRPILLDKICANTLVSREYTLFLIEKKLFFHDKNHEIYKF